ncbi:MAG TPA: hypothetical protein VH253_02020 [Phycisphaerae bacterium]|nr:hypothetical protein [Phycisphaerae bacterium]
MPIPRTLLLLPLLLTACTSPNHHPAAARTPFPTEKPTTFLTNLLTDAYHGKTDSVLDRTHFDNNNQRAVFKRLLTIAAAMQSVHDALDKTFPPNPALNPDPLDAALEPLATAITRLEPPATARVVPAPPAQPYTLIAQNHHWKLDYPRTQPGASQPISNADLKTLDEAARKYRQLAADIRAHKYPTLQAALDALNPAAHPPTTEPATSQPLP